MRSFLILCCMIYGSIQAQTKTDTIYKAGDVFVDRAIKVFTIDSSITIKLMKPLPKVEDDYTFSKWNGRRYDRIRIVTYVNGAREKYINGVKQ